MPHPAIMCLPTLSVFLQNHIFKIFGLFPLFFVFLSSHSSFGLDLEQAFSHPDAPDAGQINGLTVYSDLVAIPLDNGRMKIYWMDGDSGIWSNHHISDFVSGGASFLNGITLLEEGCLNVGFHSLDLFTTQRHFFGTLFKAHTFSGGSPFFVEAGSAMLWDLVDLSGIASSGCILAYAQKVGTGDLLTYFILSSGQSGTIELRNGMDGLLDGVIPADEEMAGIELWTGSDGAVMFLVGTDAKVYLLEFTLSGLSVTSGRLNSIPEFIGDYSATCTIGDEDVKLPVLLNDADGDDVSIIQINDMDGFDGSVITYPCAIPGTYSWAFEATDGKIDPVDRPMQWYYITVKNAEGDDEGQAPLWKNFAVSGVEDIDGTFPAATDPDGDILTYSDTIDHVTLNNDGTYTLEQNWCGSTNGTATAHDGEHATAVS
ncbi:MAG: hypothetical protein JRI67_12635, partial [Deltaproteobacteria bacterium]|nr:hypothetical protein [Deltaproteobacteria bacterium]